MFVLRSHPSIDFPSSLLRHSATQGQRAPEVGVKPWTNHQLSLSPGGWGGGAAGAGAAGAGDGDDDDDASLSIDNMTTGALSIFASLSGIFISTSSKIQPTLETRVCGAT